MNRLLQPTPPDPDEQVFEAVPGRPRKPYSRPAIIHELNLEVRAGSPNFIGFPDINPFEIGQP